MMSQPYKVIVVDDHKGVRIGIKKIIEKGGEFIVIGEAKDGQEAINVVHNKTPDLLILDVKLPVVMGEEVANQVSSSHPDLKILAMSSFDDPQNISEMFENGVQGYILKDEAPTMLKQAAKDILIEKTDHWISPALNERAQFSFRNSLKSSQTLTIVEHKILKELRAGSSIEEVAIKHSYSINRVNKYVRILLMKFNKDTLEELIRKK